MTVLNKEPLYTLRNVIQPTWKMDARKEECEAVGMEGVMTVVAGDKGGILTFTHSPCRPPAKCRPEMLLACCEALPADIHSFEPALSCNTRIRRTTRSRIKGYRQL